MVLRKVAPPATSYVGQTTGKISQSYLFHAQYPLDPFHFIRILAITARISDESSFVQQIHNILAEKLLKIGDRFVGQS